MTPLNGAAVSRPGIDSEDTVQAMHSTAAAPGAGSALPIVTSARADGCCREHGQRADDHDQPPHRADTKARCAMLASVFDPDPLPFIALMGLGFVIGVTGHVYKSRTAVATGIGMIFVATLLLPLGIYLSDS